MSSEQIIKLAREAHFSIAHIDLKKLERFAELVAAAEFQGKHYCGTHLRIAKQIHAGGVLLLEHAEQKRRADCFDDLINALKEIQSLDGRNAREVAAAAIAKATGVTA